MRRRRPWPSALLLAAAVATASAASEPWARAQARSAADVAQARELFLKAREERDAGDVRGALEKLKAAHALVPTPVVDLELGRTYRMAGQLIEARETLLAVARIPQSAEETTHSLEARREAAELAEQIAGRIPSASIVVSGMPGDQVVVSVDGVAVPSAALVAPRLMNPGAHIIVATAGSARDEARIELREGESKKVELKSTPAPTAPAALPTPVPVTPPPLSPAKEEPAPASNAPKALMGVGFGIGGLGLVVGAITGGVAMSKASAVSSACAGLVCPASAEGNLSNGRTMGNVSTAMFVVGGAGLTVGIVGVVLAKKSAPPSDAARVVPWIGLGSAGIRGAW
jgi:hypothetical protein